MKAYIRYSDIPKIERKHLVAEVRRKNTRLRVMTGVAVFVAVVVAEQVADLIIPRKESLSLHFAAALVLCLAILWAISATLISRRLEREVEHLKNA